MRSEILKKVVVKSLNCIFDRLNTTVNGNTYVKL